MIAFIAGFILGGLFVLVIISLLYMAGMGDDLEGR